MKSLALERQDKFPGTRAYNRGVDLDSWKPSDVYRRISIAVAVQLAVFLGCALVLAYGWAWWLGWPLAVLFGVAVHALAMWLHQVRRR